MPRPRSGDIFSGASRPGVRAGASSLFSSRRRTVTTIEEVPSDLDLPLRVHPGWAERFPWLIQGVTHAGEGFDLALFGPGGGGDPAWERWWKLRRTLGASAVAHGRQVHGRRVLLHRALPPGLFLAPEADGHATAARSVLLAVTVADCVPVFLLAPDAPAVTLLHAGWRGVAAGILEAGVDLLRDRLAVDPRSLHLHMGPSICGECYQVGPEVHRALGLPEPDGPEPVDLGAILEGRARELGIDPGRTTRSGWCTRCGDAPFFSYRGGDRERQVAVLGLGDGPRGAADA